MNSETEIIIIEDEKLSFTRGIPSKFWEDD